MMIDLPLFLSALALATMVASVAVAAAWMKRLRDNFRQSLKELNNKHLEYIQKLTDAVLLLQRQQKQQDGSVHSLVQSNVKLNAELAALNERITQQEISDDNYHGDRLLH